MTERKMCRLMSEAIFMQDGDPAHTAKKTQTFSIIFQATGQKEFGLAIHQI